MRDGVRNGASALTRRVTARCSKMERSRRSHSTRLSTAASMLRRLPIMMPETSADVIPVGLDAEVTYAEDWLSNPFT